MTSTPTVVLVSLLMATRSMIFWLWLVTLPSTMALLCPEECSCSVGGYDVRYGSNMTRNMPYIYRDVSVSEYFIPSLENDTFISRELTELEVIFLIRCGIATIQLGAFNGLTKVKKVVIRDNDISEILPRTFEKLSSLESLEISRNRIQYLDFDVFYGLINLKSVHLYYNSITYIHPDIFIGLHKLKEVDLEGNPGLQIPTDSHFINSQSLSHLDISHCNVMSVSAETFANVTALERLDLSYNNLTSVDIDILEELPKLSALYLYGNPLQCDCQLQEVWRWCQDHNIETADEGMAPECDTPSEVQGIWWGVLEIGQCLRDNITYFGDYENTKYSYDEFEPNIIKKLIFETLFEHQIPVYAALCTFGTAGNVILLIIIIHNKDMRTVPNMYILNLAISDIIYLIVHFLEAYIRLALLRYLDVATIYFSIAFVCHFSVGLQAYSIAVLSLQRYRATVNSVHVHVSSHSTWRAAIHTVGAVWIVSVLCTIPSVSLCNFAGYELHICLQLIAPFIMFYNPDGSRETYVTQVVVFELIVYSVVPLCVIAFTYAMTARHVLNSAGPISQDFQSSHLNTRKRTANTVLLLIFLFLISNVPYQLWIIYHYIWQEDSRNEYDSPLIHLVSSYLLFLNSCLSPVVQFYISRAFKRHLKSYLTRYCKASLCF